MVRTADILYQPDPLPGAPSIPPPAICTVRAICSPDACHCATIRTGLGIRLLFHHLRVAEEILQLCCSHDTSLIGRIKQRRCAHFDLTMNGRAWMLMHGRTGEVS